MFNPLNLRRQTDVGYSLLEILVVVVIVGILTAIAAPNLLGLLNAGRVKQGIAQVEGALKEIQNQAIRTSKTCTVTLNAANNTITANPNDCLLTNRQLNGSLNLNTNDASIIFSSKGNPDNNTDSVFIVSMTNGTSEQRCLVIAPGLGLMRTGRYDGNPTGANSINCVPLDE